MYSTMPLGDMIDHQGDRMYNILMLKPLSWNVMGKITFEEGYWQTWVKRSMYGTVKLMTNKYGSPTCRCATLR